ncbi:von Willebrand factor, type A [Artemisia annua]|uniref:von Willebrand factor, type A n=1 Tax=Artemisia annua TaxID=35608 RepID=A0A2U1LA19_ARTAN|nr:von Willebrand factor, type A [Artemisia annua]
MADIPNINELREACGSDELSHVFTFLESQDMAEDEGFLIRMRDESTKLKAKLDKRNDTIDEAWSFGLEEKKAHIEKIKAIQTKKGLVGILDLHPGAINNIPSKSHMEIAISDPSALSDESVIKAIEPATQVLAKQQIEQYTTQAWFSQDKKLEEKVAKLNMQTGVVSEYTCMILLETVQDTHATASSSATKH